MDEAARRNATARTRRQLAFGEATIPQSSGIPMSLAMLKECRARGMELGGHGRSHVPLPKLGDLAAHAEITGARADLAAITGIEAPAFAYPHGEHDGRIRALVESAGYAFAVDTREDLVEPRRYDLALPRIAVGNCSGEELCERIAALGG